MIPNYPMRRAQNYFADRPFWSRRWISQPLSRIAPGFENLHVAGDPNMKPKHEDPDWRKNWGWALFESTGALETSPYFFSELKVDEVGMRLMFPIKTRHFAMRIGPDPILLLTVDRNPSWVRVPKRFEILEPQAKGRNTLPAKLLAELAKDQGLQVTFI